MARELRQRLREVAGVQQFDVREAMSDQQRQAVAKHCVVVDEQGLHVGMAGAGWR